MTTISDEERKNVEAVVIDMWDSYKNLAKIYFKNANGYNNFNRLRNRIIFSINKNVPIKGTPNKK